MCHKHSSADHLTFSQPDQLYYLYEKSPKKAHELISVVTELKEVFEFPQGGNIPVRAQGSRWISHKRKALQRVVDRLVKYRMFTYLPNNSGTLFVPRNIKPELNSHPTYIICHLATLACIISVLENGHTKISYWLCTPSILSLGFRSWHCFCYETDSEKFWHIAGP